MLIPIEKLVPDPEQLRKEFNQKDLEELAQGYNGKGPIYPILARPITEGRFMIVDGHMRWRAAEIAGLKEMECIVRKMTDKEAKQTQLIANLIRYELKPMEKAKGLKSYKDKYQLSVREVARRIGKDPSYVSRYISLVEDLDVAVCNTLEAGFLTYTQCFHIAEITNKGKQCELANFVAGGKVKEEAHIAEIVRRINLDAKNEATVEKIIESVVKPPKGHITGQHTKKKEEKESQVVRVTIIKAIDYFESVLRSPSASYYQGTTITADWVKRRLHGVVHEIESFLHNLGEDIRFVKVSSEVYDLLQDGVNRGHARDINELIEKGVKLYLLRNDAYISGGILKVYQVFGEELNSEIQTAEA